MLKWICNETEQKVWRECAPKYFPREMVEHVASYLYDPYYEYRAIDKGYFACLLWMSGEVSLTNRIKAIIETQRLSPKQVADEILQLYLTHPNDIVANTQEQVIQWLKGITQKYEEFLKTL